MLWSIQTGTQVRTSFGDNEENNRGVFTTEMSSFAVTYLDETVVDAASKITISFL